MYWLKSSRISRFIQAAFRGRSAASARLGPALDQDQLVGVREVWSHVWKGESSKVSAFPAWCCSVITQLAQNVYSPSSLTVRCERRWQTWRWRRIRSSGISFHVVDGKTNMLIVTRVFLISCWAPLLLPASLLLLSFITFAYSHTHTHTHAVSSPCSSRLRCYLSSFLCNFLPCWLFVVIYFSSA